MKRLLAGLLLVTAGWLASPSAVPVYDGVGSPDEPYRYVGRSNAPVAVSATVDAHGGSSAPLRLQSPENGPQVLLELAAGALTTTARTVTLTATPVAGDGQRAPQGTIDGNVYRITATGGARLATAVTQGFLYLRAAEMTKPDPVIVHRDGPSGPWTAVTTTRTGRDVMTTSFSALGDYAVVDLPGAKPLSAAGSGWTSTRVLLLAGGVLLLVVVTVLALRRTGPAEDPEAG